MNISNTYKNKFIKAYKIDLQNLAWYKVATTTFSTFSNPEVPKMLIISRDIAKTHFARSFTYVTDVGWRCCQTGKHDKELGFQTQSS